MQFDYVARGLARWLTAGVSLRRSFSVSSVVKMSSSKLSYEDAIHKLNALQSNKSTLEQIRRNLKSGKEKCTNLEDMENYLMRTGVTMSKLDELSVIHVAGTKGKGSTSAMCESILRAHGLRTGLYTSPHLIAVRERIRLDGALVTTDQFATHFHHVYDLLYESQAYEGDMPKYFAFLTVLAFNIFLKEKVDVAIVEVGIGGIVDYTNVLRKVPVVGITALGLDHTSILGTTIEQIAAAKAGIMKRDCEAYTVRQPRAAMPVLRTVADEVKDAIHKLNALQSNKSTLEQIRRNLKSGKEKCTNLEDMENYLMRTGVTMSKLDELSVIHVAGTKGKGSTSAMCESILRAHGLRTGLYTSPHLIAVRERIRLDGALVTTDQFATHFHHVYDLLYESQAYEGDMPKYFAFLTVLAFNIFLKEKVDVAIVEVGIGGIVDYTNVLRKVPVVGITALGLDHTSILGTTIEQIAAAKAGIMKRDCEAYTVRQPRAAMPVLRTVADEVQCTLNVVPDYDSYAFPKDCQTALPVDLDAYKTNASLAIQLAHSWMRLAKIQVLNQRNIRKQVISGKIMIQSGFIDIDAPYIDSDKQVEEMIVTVPRTTVIGLRECRWPGRFQVIQSDYATFYLDGAHTKESMEICANWFLDNNREKSKVLIFSATGDRDAEVLLKPLTDIKFAAVYFVIPTAYRALNQRNDNYSILAEEEDLVNKCHIHSQIWKRYQNDSSTKLTVLKCVSEALIDIKRNFKDDIIKGSVLISGSLHLVGAALSILDPNLCKD